MPMIHVSRDLVCRCSEELAKTNRWKQRPCRSLVNLIYGLNSIARDIRTASRDIRIPSGDIRTVSYNYGFPMPSVAVRDLKRLRGLALRRKNPEGVAKRLETLIEVGIATVLSSSRRLFCVTAKRCRLFTTAEPWPYCGR